MREKERKQTGSTGKIQNMSSKATEPKFSMSDVAEIIGVNISTISRLMDSSKLGYYQIGRRRIVGESHLQNFLSLAERRAKVTTLH